MLLNISSTRWLSKGKIFLQSTHPFVKQRGVLYLGDPIGLIGAALILMIVFITLSYFNSWIRNMFYLLKIFPGINNFWPTAIFSGFAIEFAFITVSIVV